jgi:hypothetical protein
MKMTSSRFRERRRRTDDSVKRVSGITDALLVAAAACWALSAWAGKLPHSREQRSGVRVAPGIVLGAAVGGAVMVPLGDVAGQSHVPAGDLQELRALGRVTQPLGGPQALGRHSLVSFTRGHDLAP